MAVAALFLFATNAPAATVDGAGVSESDETIGASEPDKAADGTEAPDAPEAAEAPPPIEFGGEVARGNTVVHRFQHGDTSFEFRLVPFSGGWTIWLGEPVNHERNYVAVATGPFHGVNPAVIEGWHFRNAYNTGPNEPGEKNVNAPGLERGFAFVLDSASYASAFAARDAVLAGGVNESAEAARQRLADIPTGTGTLVIDALELGNLLPDQRAIVQRMAFTVRLEFPE